MPTAKKYPLHCITAERVPPHFGLTLLLTSLPPRNEKPLTAKKLSPYPIPAEKKRPYFGLPLLQTSWPPKNEEPPTAKKLPPYSIPAEKYRHILVYRFCQRRYHPKMKNRLPPNNYRRMEIPPRPCPYKKTLTTTTLEISNIPSVFLFRRMLVNYRRWSAFCALSDGKRNNVMVDALPT